MPAAGAGPFGFEVGRQGADGLDPPLIGNRGRSTIRTNVMYKVGGGAVITVCRWPTEHVGGVPQSFESLGHEWKRGRQAGWFGRPEQDMLGPGVNRVPPGHQNRPRGATDWLYLKTQKFQK